MRRPDIPNWTSGREAAALVDLAAGKLVLEVGAFKGFGTVLMAQAGARVWAVDWHRGDQDLGPQDTLCAWWTNVRRHHVEDQVVGLVGRSTEVMPVLRELCFDLVFIDAAHQEAAVRADIAAAARLLRLGGSLAFHDYSRIWPGVVNAVNAERNRHRQVCGHDHFRVVDSLAVLTCCWGVIAGCPDLRKESSRDS